MPQHVQPLEEHPQLRILRTSLSDRPGDEVVEYRVYNYRIRHDGMVVRGDTSPATDLIWAASLWAYSRYFQLSAAWSQLVHHRTCEAPFVIWLVALLVFMYIKARTVLYQSVLAIPGLGVQLETTRGIAVRLTGLSSAPQPHWALSTSSHFIPLEQISTIVINEGLRRWRVEYYLAIIQRESKGITVAFDSVKAPVAVLKEVLHGLRETLYDEYDEYDEGDGQGEGMGTGE